MPWGEVGFGKTAPASVAPTRGGGWGSVGNASVAPSTATTHHSGGVFGVLGNFGKDVESTIAGIPTGVVETAEHPIRVAKAIGRQYAATYSPLIHGHFGEFAHEVGQHPLGPLLDALTVATLGAGGVARAGEALGKAGVIAEDARLANLAHAADLTVPDFGAGEDITVKQSSRNPLVRARQQAVNEALNRLPSETPVVGSTARGVRALSRGPERAAAKIGLQAENFRKSFEQLSPQERVAWHLKARAITPVEYRGLIAKSGRPNQATLKLLADPKVARLVRTPSQALQRALDDGRALSEKLTRLKVEGGHLDEVTALEAPFRHARLVTGARYTASGLVGGKSIEKLTAEGRNPFYVPDSAHMPGLRGRFNSRPAGFSAPVSGVKQSRGILASTGNINFHDNALLRDFNTFRGNVGAQLLHDELVKHAAILPKGEPLPHGYEELKLNRGASSLPYTRRVGGTLEHELTPQSTVERVKAAGQRGPLPEQTPTVFKNGNPTGQDRLIVPSQVKRLVEDASRTPRSKLAHLGYTLPTNVWKHLVLGLRPAFFGNITIGNSILGTLQMAPGRWGLVGWLNQVLPGAEHLFGSKLTDETMRDVFPEQMMGTFGHSTGFTANRGLNVAQKAYQGVMPATIAYENVLRRAMAEGWAKATPEVQELMRRNGGDVNTALREVARTKPQVIDAISKRIDNALGNYRTYNRLERAIKTIAPFYGWNRHITQSVARLASERPQVLDALLNEGQQGKAAADRILGALPSYLEGSVKAGLPSWLGGGVPGATSVLTTKSWNPFNTLSDEGKMLAFPFARAGTNSDAFPINPFVQMLLEQLSGKDFLTGAPIKGNAIRQEAPYLVPQEQLLQQLVSGRHPRPNQVNQNTAYGQLARLLGLPVESLNLAAAQAAAAKGR